MELNGRFNVIIAVLKLRIPKEKQFNLRRNMSAVIRKDLCPKYLFKVMVEDLGLSGHMGVILFLQQGN